MMRAQRGVALVEFAIVSGLLFLLVFGIIEFGSGYNQSLNVRHGAREAARLAAVNYRPVQAHTLQDQANDILGEACLRMDNAGSGTTLQLTYPAGQSGTRGAAGNKLRVSASRPLTQMTGFLDPFLSGKTLNSTVSILIEVDATWLPPASDPASLTCP